VSIDRIDPGARFSSAVVHGGLVFLAGHVSHNGDAGVREQTREILESIDHIVEEVADDSVDPDRAEDKLRRAQSWADRLAQSGRLAEARSIYFYLLDNILGLEERLGKGPLFSQDLKEDLFEEYCQFIHEDRQLERDLVQQELERLESHGAVSRGELDLSEVKQEVQGAS